MHIVCVEWWYDGPSLGCDGAVSRVRLCFLGCDRGYCSGVTGVLQAMVHLSDPRVCPLCQKVRTRRRTRRSIPSRSIPSRSNPSRSIPSRSIPSRSIPSRSIPSRSIPSRSSIPSCSIPSRSSNPSRSIPSHSSNPSRLIPSRSIPSRSNYDDMLCVVHRCGPTSADQPSAAEQERVRVLLPVPARAPRPPPVLPRHPRARLSGRHLEDLPWALTTSTATRAAPSHPQARLPGLTSGRFTLGSAHLKPSSMVASTGGR
eukprot:1195815-Prorocentrum_minimum.AAC.8